MWGVLFSQDGIIVGCPCKRGERRRTEEEKLMNMFKGDKRKQPKASLGYFSLAELACLLVVKTLKTH